HALAQRDRLLAAGHVPTWDEGREQRAQRDAEWRLLRRHLVPPGDSRSVRSRSGSWQPRDLQPTQQVADGHDPAPSHIALELTYSAATDVEPAGAPPVPDTDAFESAMQSADDTVDALARDTERAAQLQACQHEIDRL